jgi:predicted ferric reductase
MISQLKNSTYSYLRILADIILLAFGVVVGGLVALVGLWLWFDYQADPNHGYLAFLSLQLQTFIPVQLRDLLSAQAQLMGLPLAGKTSAFWYMARAGGFLAYLLLWFSIIWGLTLSTKVMTTRIPASVAYGLHEFLSILAICFALLHAVVLLGDEYIKFNLFQLMIPFTAPYRPVWTGLGTITLYLGIVMIGSFYIRKQIGQKAWRILHYLTFGVYGLSLVHGLMAGSDSPLVVVKLLYLGTGLSVLFLVYYRLFTLK